MKRPFVIINIVVGTFLFLLSCSKSNHDTLVTIGEENYIKPIDSIYPAKYRNDWRDLAPISINDPNYDTIYNGVFPPDLNGKYRIEAKFGNGNDSIINSSGQAVPYTHYKQAQTITVDIFNQRNGLASINYKESYSDPNIPDFECTVDSVYIYGNGADGSFTICFDIVESYYGDENYLYGVLITGKKDATALSDINKWKLFKGGGQGFVVGGQHYYYAENVDMVE